MICKMQIDVRSDNIMLFDLKTALGTLPLKCSGNCGSHVEIDYKPYHNIWCQGLLRAVVCPLRYYKPKEEREVCCANAAVSAANLENHFTYCKRDSHRNVLAKAVGLSAHGTVNFDTMATSQFNVRVTVSEESVAKYLPFQ